MPVHFVIPTLKEDLELLGLSVVEAKQSPPQETEDAEEEALESEWVETEDVDEQLDEDGFPMAVFENEDEDADEDMLDEDDEIDEDEELSEEELLELITALLSERKRFRVKKFMRQRRKGGGLKKKERLGQMATALRTQLMGVPKEEEEVDDPALDEEEVEEAQVAKMARLAKMAQGKGRRAVLAKKALGQVRMGATTGIRKPGGAKATNRRTLRALHRITVAQNKRKEQHKKQVSSRDEPTLSGLIEEVERLVSSVESSRKEEAVSGFKQVQEASVRLSGAFVYFAEELEEESFVQMAQAFSNIATQAEKIVEGLEDGTIDSTSEEVRDLYERNCQAIFDGLDVYEDVKKDTLSEDEELYFDTNEELDALDEGGCTECGKTEGDDEDDDEEDDEEGDEEELPSKKFPKLVKKGNGKKSEGNG